MASYLIRRLLLVPFTLWAVFTLSFFIIQTAPGGPVETFLLQIQGLEVDLAARQFGEAGGSELGQAGQDNQGQGGNADPFYQGRRDLDARAIEKITELYGLDKPLGQRYIETLGRYLRFEFGDSLFRGQSVVALFMDKLPVSASLGFWTFWFGLVIAIPLGIWKARRDGSKGDAVSTPLLIAIDAVPGFLIAILLLAIFANPNVLDWFPRRGLTSPGWSELGFWAQLRDYFWHITLPVLVLAVGGYSVQTLFIKNAFLDQLRMAYVTTARAKGLSETRVLFGHVFRNAMLLPLAGLPAMLFGLFLAGSILIESIFTLDGLGLMGLKAVQQRDYPVIFAQIWVFGLVGLLLNLVTDISYTLIDPRINFGTAQRQSA